MNSVLKIIMILLAGLTLQVAAQQNPQSALDQQAEQQLQLVGEATLSRLFWTIYDCRLYTTNGSYRGIEPDLVLEIAYRINISAKQLVSSTRQEWQALSLYKEQLNEAWLEQLAHMWPDVGKGDVIKLSVDGQLNSHFYVNGKAIGIIRDAAFTRQFLAIWLSPSSRYSDMRLQLIGRG